MNEVDEFLEHYGVKGMKWGQRKAAIKSARNRSAATGLKLSDAHKRGVRAKSKKEKEAALKEIKSLVKKHRESGDIDVAAKLTLGEKGAHILLAGPLAAVTIPMAERSNRKVDNAILDSYSNLKIGDLG